MRRSMTRARSMMRARRVDSTPSNPAMPANRNTGATASRMTSATASIEFMGSPSRDRFGGAVCRLVANLISAVFVRARVRLLFAKVAQQNAGAQNRWRAGRIVSFEESGMHKGNSYLLIGVAAAATALASAAHAGGEAGKLELRDVGAKFVGYTTKSADNGSVDVLNPLFVQYLLPE